MPFPMSSYCISYMWDIWSCRDVNGETFQTRGSEVAYLRSSEDIITTRGHCPLVSCLLAQCPIFTSLGALEYQGQLFPCHSHISCHSHFDISLWRYVQMAPPFTDLFFFFTKLFIFKCVTAGLFALSVWFLWVLIWDLCRCRYVLNFKRCQK